jgi:hypothetical protein
MRGGFKDYSDKIMKMFGVSKDEYDKVVKANNEMRIKMEKMRLENALLKDQIRAMKKLPPEQSSIYIYLQLKEAVSLDGILESPNFSGREKADIINSLEELLRKKLIDVNEKDGVDYYSVNTGDASSSIMPSDATPLK